MHPNIFSSAINNSQIMERAPKYPSMDEQINRILLSDEKKWNLAICNNVAGTRGYYAEQNKSARERQILLYDFIHMWNLRNTTDEHKEGKEK